MISTQKYPVVVDSSSRQKDPQDPDISTVESVSTLCSDSDEERATVGELEPIFERMAERFEESLNPVCQNGQVLTPLVHRVIRFLMSCRYDSVDISSVLAVTIMHHKILIDKLGGTILSYKERSFIIVAQMYIAHCIVLDECCVLSNWHKYLFSSYCDLNCLKRAVSRILKRMEYNLAVDPDRVSAMANHINNFS